MRSIAVALCMAALAGAAGMVDFRSDSVSVSMPETEGRRIESAGQPNDPWRNLTAEEANEHLRGAEVCNCKSGKPCDCEDCQCEDCPCATIRKSRTVESPKSPTVKQDLIADPVTGVEVSGPAIIQLTIHGCEPCIRWVQQEAGKYRKAGWKVPYPVSGIKAPAYPSFRIYDGKRWHQHTGWLTGDDMRRILGGGTASSSNPRASAGAAVVRDPAAAAVSFGRDWLIGGQPWTRQSLIDHLATHSSHGHSRASLQSMSFGQLNALHNADHESQRAPMRSTVMSSCPGGSCPPQSYSSSRRRGLFGGWR